MRLCWYSSVLYEHWRGCVGTADYYRSIGIFQVLVQQCITGAFGTVLVPKSTELCWYRRVLQLLCGSCACTEEYTRNSREAVLVKQSTKGALGRLCWYSRALQEYSGGCAGIEEFCSSTRGLCCYSGIQ